MPCVTIEIRKQYTSKQEIALINAVHTAMIEALKILPSDKNIRLVEHPAHRFAVSPTLAQPENYTLISIDMFAGRSLAAKKGLYRSIVNKLAAFEIPADHIKILLREIPRENWGIRGGYAASEIELGFEINV